MAIITERNRDKSESTVKGWRPRALAKELGLANATVYNAVAAGELAPVWKFGKSIVIPQSSVDAWLESKSTDTADRDAA